MKNLHFTAVGGAVMHQLALALHRAGNNVTGSDDEINDPAKKNLAEAGLLPAEAGWHPGRVSDVLDGLILGMHAKKDNPELARAQELGIPVYSFPQYVYEVSRDKQRVVVAGSHGKTTITSMIMHVLRAAGKDFDYLVGAKVPGFEASVRLSEAPLIVLEGDEYPASAVEPRPKIFFYHPHISVLSGIAWDHVNVFPTYENYLSQFETYLRGMAAGSLLFYNNEDEAVRALVAKAASHLQAMPYGTPAFHYENGGAVLDTEGGPVALSVFGRHNLLNLEGARAVCAALGVDEGDFYSAIASFTGAARRLEALFENDRVVAFRDFAHAPSKLRATLDAVREAYPERKLIALFELHTYSSLSAQFLGEYAGSMDSADAAIVYFSHHALALKGLQQLERGTVAGHFGGGVAVLDDRAALLERVKSLLADAGEPVCLLLMSSGTFDGIDWTAALDGGGNAG